MKVHMENRSVFKEILIIITFSILIAFVFNYFSKKGISVIYQAEIVPTVSDSLLFQSEIYSSSGIESSATTVTTQQLQKLIESGNDIIIDARNAEIYGKGYIPSAINIPFVDVFNYMETLNSLSRDKLIIVYCEGINCDLSKKLIEFMRDMHFTKIFDYHEGYEGWIKENLKTERTSNEISGK